MRKFYLSIAFFTLLIFNSNFLLSQNYWTSISTGLSSNGIFTLLVNGTNYFAGTNGGGVYLSTNNGSSWSPANTNLNNNYVRRFAVIGSNIFAGTFGGGVNKTTNNGTSWTQVNTGLGNLDVWGLATDGTNLFAGTWGGGVKLSTNNGTSWTAVNTNLTNLNVRYLYVSGTNLFAGTWGGGVFLSTNNGTSWSAVNTNLTNLSIWCIISNGTNLFVGTNGGGVFSSSNNGANWTSVNSGLSNLTVISLATIGTNLFASTSNGIFKSTNNGTSWTAITSGLTSTDVWSLTNNGTIILSGAMDGKVYYHTNSSPTITTTTASSITHNSASSGGDVTDDGGLLVSERGVVWGLSTNPTTSSYAGKSNSGTGTGTYSVSLAGLSSNTTYHYRAYAINSVGTSYGSDLTFTTDAAPTPDNASISLNYNQNGNTWEDNNSNNSDGTVPNGGGTPDGGDGTDPNFGNNSTWTFDGSNDCFQIPYNQNSGRLNQNSAKSLFVYFRTSLNIQSKQVLIELGGTNSGMNAYIYSGKIWVGIWNSSQRRFFSKTISTGNNFLLSVEFNGTKVRTSLNGECSSSMLFSGFASNSNTNGIGASINGTRYMDATSGTGLYNFFSGTIAEILLYNSCDQSLRESVIDFIDTKYSQNYSDDYTGYFGKVNTENWDLNEWEESPMSTTNSENLLNASQNKSLLKVNFESKATNNYSINMYDLNGQLIKSIFNGNLEIGTSTFELDIDQISSGNYIIEAKSSDFQEAKNILIVK